MNFRFIKYNVERFQRPRQNSGPQAIGYSEPQVRNELSANAQIQDQSSI